jgi:acetylornithine deacetylase/succinyl-diaminopimelate desuccinylase-like protein
MSEPTTIYQRPAELLQALVRFDTTNPPGNEAECIGYIDGLLKSLGIETTILAKDPQRPNIVARLKGSGKAAPLLLYGHVDVVTTAGQQWSRPPFAAEVAEGFIWGRGTLDMKGGVGMMLAAFLRAKAQNLSLPGDVVFCAVSDEEAGGDVGAQFLVTEHADLFKRIKYALGEFGGFTLHMGGQRFYPIMVAEKQICSLKVTLRGPAGHGSMPLRGGAMAKAAKLLSTLDKKRLPVHVTPVVRQTLETMSAHLSFPTSTLLRQLLNPLLTDRILDAMGPRGRTLNPLLHNTVSPTMIQASDKINVIPGEVNIGLDGRLLPGFTPDDMLRELKGLLGSEPIITVERYDPGPPDPDMGLFDTLADILREADPGGIPTPLLLSAVTDGRSFAQLGIQTYGFLPMQLPEGFNFSETIHAANERIPVRAMEFGTDAIYKALERFGDA